MNNLNSIILEGNLVRDAQLTEPAPGFKKCAFSIAVNRFFKNRKNDLFLKLKPTERWLNTVAKKQRKDVEYAL